MLTAREQILRDIRQHLPTDAALPPLDGPWTRYDDPLKKFCDVLREVGGAGRGVQSAAALREELDRLCGQLGTERICSALPDVLAGNVDLGAIDDPHDLADVDLAILPGELAVAENGAVWVTAAAVRQRVAFFLSQHVALVLPADRVVHNMHEAYAWLHRDAGAEGPFASARWGAFLSGPSKTADIEQALVIGAHGARSLHVFVVG